MEINTKQSRNVYEFPQLDEQKNYVKKLIFGRKNAHGISCFPHGSVKSDGHTNDIRLLKVSKFQPLRVDLLFKT